MWDTVGLNVTDFIEYLYFLYVICRYLQILSNNLFFELKQCNVQRQSKYYRICRKNEGLVIFYVISYDIFSRDIFLCYSCYLSNEENNEIIWYFLFSFIYSLLYYIFFVKYLIHISYLKYRFTRLLASEAALCQSLTITLW